MGCLTAYELTHIHTALCLDHLFLSGTVYGTVDCDLGNSGIEVFRVEEATHPAGRGLFDDGC